MKRKNPLVSISSAKVTNKSSEHSFTRRSPSVSPKARLTSSFRIGGSSRTSVFLVNLSRLLVPLFVLISTTCCTTTTSLSPLGLYKVGIGATNLVDNILGSGIVKSKTTSPKTIHTPDGTDTVVNQSKNSHSISLKQKGKRNHKDFNKSKEKGAITNRKKRRAKNKSSVKRSNHDIEKKNAIEIGSSKTKTKTKITTKTLPEAHKNNTKTSIEKAKTSKVPDKNKSTKADNDDDEESNNMMRIPGISEEDQKFLERVQASARTVERWDDDKELLKKCRSVIPWEALLGAGETNGSNKSGERPYCDSETDRLLRASGVCFGNVAGGADSNALFLQRLCRWFQSYMSWVNAPPCKVCGCKDTEMKTVRAPETREEIEGEAKRVEVYYCPTCDANTTTFPRYNKAAKLLETRQGRCGEYANLFGLFCRSVGFETRLVLDLSDHLWTEIRLGDSWIMADACEGVIDKPSMYEHGWGKSGLCYMVSIGRDHVVDVTPRYTRQFHTEDFQTRRRSHTTSEETGERLLRHLNQSMKLSPTKLEELERRQMLEQAELQQCKQATEWTEQEKYGSGRISGSLEWRRSRQEAGSDNNRTAHTETANTSENQDNCEEAGFPVEAFVPTRLKKGKVSFLLRARPSSRHDRIVVSDTPCAVGVTKSISVVVVDNDDKNFGCILQSKSFGDWNRVVQFIDALPSGRIVLMNGKVEIGNETKPEDFYKEVQIKRLGGWKGKEVVKDGILFVGQIDVHPDWAYCETVKCALNDKSRNGVIGTHEVEFDGGVKAEGMSTSCRLRTERLVMPQRIAGRLPEAIMPLASQQSSATEREKREAYLRFAKTHGGRYCGYTTKKDSPVYLLDSTAYPLQHSEYAKTNVSGNNNHTWNTFLELPEPLVPSTDNGINDAPNSASSAPTYDVPLDSGFFKSSLGSKLLSSVDVKEDTADALTNTRLIGLYFSAHWCGPCRSFTPMLAEMYDVLSETNPSHGLEIVFVSSDRDEQSFRHYFQTMPWKAIPFDQLQFVKQALNMTYGVRGIPSFVVLDAVSGEIVVSAKESRQEVVTACRGGDLRIEAMLQSWLGRTPAATKELLSTIEISACEMETNADDVNDVDSDKNPYLKRRLDLPDQNEDISVRIKAQFEKLVNAGHDPNTAAAKAIKIVSETRDAKTMSKLPPGRLDGKASYAGRLRPGSEDDIDQALVYALEQNGASTVSNALSIALKYLQNSQRMPWESKFRRFKLSNKVADKITRVEGGLGLIQSLGFEIVGTGKDFEGSIPVAANLNAMETRITQLIDDLA